MVYNYFVLRYNVIDPEKWRFKWMSDMCDDVAFHLKKEYSSKKNWARKSETSLKAFFR